MVGWHHWFNRHELGQTPGDGKGQGHLACFSPWGCRESDTTWQLNNIGASYSCLFCVSKFYLMNEGACVSLKLFVPAGPQGIRARKVESLFMDVYSLLMGDFPSACMLYYQHFYPEPMTHLLSWSHPHSTQQNHPHCPQGLTQNSWPLVLTWQEKIEIYALFIDGSAGKEFAFHAGDTGDAGLTPGRPPREGNGNPLQRACLQNPMDRGTWRDTVHGVTESRTQFSTHTDVLFTKMSKPA